MKLKSLNEQVVVVFGASSGIGRLAARRLAEQGAAVVVSARSEEGLDSLVSEIRARCGEAVAVPSEVTNFQDVRLVAEEAVSRYGGLDTWVHLAAVSSYSRLEETPPEEFARIVEVNLVGQAYGAMAALPHLRKRGQGALIFVSSVEAMRGLPLQSAYAASKHGVHGLAESLRVELRHDRVRVSVTEILPSTIDTTFYNKARSRLGVRPMGVPPVYSPELVVDAIMRAAQHPTREIVVGGAGKALLVGQWLSPRLVDFLLTRAGFATQRSSVREGADSPGNLFEPIEGHDRVESTLPDLKRMRASRFARRLGLAAGLGLAAYGLSSLVAPSPRMPSPDRFKKGRSGEAMYSDREGPAEPGSISTWVASSSS